MSTKLYIPKPDFDSTITKCVVELQTFRNRPIIGTTKPWLFFELKNIFHTIESIASARIEGNHTTVASFVEAVREDDGAKNPAEEIQEIINLENGIRFIEKQTKGFRIDRGFILQLHRITVEGLVKEGDKRSGAYRIEPRYISGSSHVPPPASDVNDLMNELIEFINSSVESHFDLLKDAVAHHRFTWIHPFGNGNGRVVRLLTYAMLTQQGFIDAEGRRLLNSTALFGSNRKGYYSMLADADKGTKDGLLLWSEYMLQGLKTEADNVTRLLDEEFTRDRIVVPALEYALDKKRINPLEFGMLGIANKKGVVQASDFRDLFPKDVSHVNISKAIRKLREQGLIRPVVGGSRRYTLRLNRNALTLGIVMQLDQNNFLPMQVDA